MQGTYTDELCDEPTLTQNPVRVPVVLIPLVYHRTNPVPRPELRNGILPPRHHWKSGQYYCQNKSRPEVLPLVYIPQHAGAPFPVIDRDSGELVHIFVDCDKFDPETPNPSPISSLIGQSLHW